MWAKTFRRQLTGVAKVAKPLAYPVDRHSPQNVLNTSPVSVAAEIASEYKRHKLTNSETRVRVNLFLEAVFLVDTAQATQTLTRLREKCMFNRHVESFARNLEVYLSCLVTMMAHFCQRSRKFNNAEIEAVILAIEEIPRHVAQSRPETVLRLRLLLMILILRAMSDLQTNDSRATLVTRARILAEQMNLVPAEIGRLVSQEHPELVPHCNLVWRNTAKTYNDANGDKKIDLCIDQYKTEDGNMSYQSLCRFIASTRFDALRYSSDPHAKMYAVYEKLTREEQKAFLQDYLAFNKQKQLLVEEYCGDLHESLHSMKSLHIFGAASSKWIQAWHSQTSEALEKEKDRPHSEFAFFLSVVLPATFASFALSSILAQTLPSGEAKLHTLASSMAYSFKRMLKRDKKLVSLLQRLPMFLNDEAAIQFFVSIIKVVIEACKLPSDIPHAEHETVFSTDYTKANTDSPGYKRVGVVKVHPFLPKQFETCLELFLSGSYLLPMLHPPKEWVSPENGGFFDDLVPLVKSIDQESTSFYMAQAHRTGQLDSIYESLNALGSVSWAINPSMLGVFNDAMSDKGGFMHIPGIKAPDSCEMLEKPQRCDFKAEKDYLSALARHRLTREARLKKKKEAHSLRVYYELVNTLARSLEKNGDSIFYPQNIDFRGRVYPCVSFLSHHSEDLVRSLLMFWEAKPLGPKGYDWLQYQLANLHSDHFLSMEKLKAFVANNKEAIIESAKSPMSPQSWWRKGDSPWQCLAMCMELKNVWEYEGKKEEYLSRIPIHMDGTCNGLQHYAALGADKDAAVSVNLIPDTKKHDVYVTVLNRVRERVVSDLESVSDETAETARQVLPLLSRKIVKQTVMTTVYGVTLYGAFRQIREKLDEVFQEGSSVGEYNPQTAKMATYVAKHVLDAISDLFAGAKKIQNWLLENCRRCISAYEKHSLPEGKINFFDKKRYRPMMWTSLSGLPVIQPYRKNTTKEITTVLQRLSVQTKGKLAHIDFPKQLNGIAPNFIHLLDAMHLLMTCLACKQSGISFVAVHDSFWTHPGDVEKLNSHIRQEFVRLHKSEIVANLREDLKHVNRNAFQVVWVDNTEAKDFIVELSKLRQQYGPSRNSPSAWNICLNEEFSANTEVENLVERYRPELLYDCGKHAIVYDSKREVRERGKISNRTHTPILVPVQITEKPELGDLDIDLVLESKYFFS